MDVDSPPTANELSYSDKRITWTEDDFTISQELVTEVAKEVTQAETKTAVKLLATSGKENPDVCAAATKDAANAIPKADNKVGSPRLLDKINPDKNEKASDIEYFRIIPDKLDLNDDYICKLLPYLLTAYVCSVNRNSVYLRGKASRRHIYGNSDIGDEFEMPREARLNSQNERLSKCFSLKGITFRRQKTRKEKPQPYIVNRRNPYIDAEFATLVFELFAAITCDKSKCKDKTIQNVVKKIDLKSCYFLLLSYTRPDELYELSIA